MLQQHHSQDRGGKWYLLCLLLCLPPPLPPPLASLTPLTPPPLLVPLTPPPVTPVTSLAPFPPLPLLPPLTPPPPPPPFPPSPSPLANSTTLANSTFWLATEFVELSRGYCTTNHIKRRMKVQTNKFHHKSRGLF